MDRTNDVEGHRPRGPLGELAHDLRELLRLELELAKTEIKGEMVRARTAAIMLGSAVVLGTLGAAMLPVALAFGLGLVIPLWAAFLIAGVCFSGIAAALGALGAKRLGALDPLPRRAMQKLGDLGDEVGIGRSDAAH